jgi:glycosyltransferase involved in cell wall biosynthesis
MNDKTVDIFGWLADRTGCGTIRVMQPLDTIAETSDVTTQYSEGLSTKGFMPKVIIGQRVCKDKPSRLWQLISEMEKRPKLVFEVDDDLWNIDPSNSRAFNWFLNGIEESTGTYHDVQNNLAMNISVADRVTCTTPSLAKLLSQWNDDVRVVPNYIPRWMTERERPRRDRLTVGWVGSSTHNMDWDTASNYVRKFLQRNPEVEFKLIGARYGNWLKLPQEQVVETGWFDSVEECWRNIDFDIGIAPLRPHVFNRSKSAIKFLEYAALGIPTVASDVGPYADNIEHGVTGFLVKRDHEWTKYLRDLTNDEAMRKEIGDNAREWAKTQILEDHIDEWKDTLCEW